MHSLFHCSHNIAFHHKLYQAGHQQYMALPINVVTHKFEILLLLSIRCVVIDAAHKARNVSMFVRANDQPLGRISCPKECHKTVTIVVFSVLQIINISSKFRYEGHIFNICISLHSETANSYV